MSVVLPMLGMGGVAVVGACPSVQEARGARAHIGHTCNEAEPFGSDADMAVSDDEDSSDASSMLDSEAGRSVGAVLGPANALEGGSAGVIQSNDPVGQFAAMQARFTALDFHQLDQSSARALYRELEAAHAGGLADKRDARKAGNLVHQLFVQIRAWGPRWAASQSVMDILG